MLCGAVRWQRLGGGMGDDRSSDDSSKLPKKGVDFSKPEGLSNVLGGETPNPNEVRSQEKAAPRIVQAKKATTPSGAIQDAIKSISGGAAMEGLHRAAAQIGASKKMFGPTHELQERLSALTGQVGPISGIGKIVKQLQDQHRSIDALRFKQPSMDTEPFLLTELQNLPNPVHETNDRLERIEQRFEKMLDVAANGAEIATGLQAHAAEFLVKFENAASNNDRSAARAIRLGAIAVVIALAMPLTQILYTELWRVPQDSKSMEAAITDMQAEMVRLRQMQIEVADRIAAALERSDQQMVEALRDVVRTVTAPAPASVEVPTPME